MKHDHSNFNARRAYASGIDDRVAQFLPMVRKLAWYYASSCSGSIDLDDLMQSGLIALTECAQRHDRPSDDGFAAYAKMRVRGAMIDLLRSQSHHTRGALQMRRKLEQATDALRSELGREPSADELARAMHISLEELHDTRRQIHTSMSSIEDCYSDSDPAFRCEDPDAETSLLQLEDRAGLAQAIAALPERLQLVIKLHFVEELNLTEIAAVLEVSVPRVHQLKSAALEKLRLSIAAADRD
ncbi:flagellar protein [Erythrobacter sp. QSSC1-22B]|uniref:sigma-70 family RNA polymerase sigma factor n=1 Tax=Erythrobacter sp. QSSC1-22B TaxID=1860125 RepID=UPI0008052551|nr:sigma-70 family RNA polymerase sigma factor [Erythrobacter sp. QSSC1-22B]OBX18850.1 flagellar protein [Erythrobacter sp. QSSC1-22B]